MKDWQGYNLVGPSLASYVPAWMKMQFRFGVPRFCSPSETWAGLWLGPFCDHVKPDLQNQVRSKVKFVHFEPSFKDLNRA